MKKQQQGAYLVIVALLMAVLVAFGAFAIDGGRLYVMRSEMQNAADAAALAAAAELDNLAGARADATQAARQLLEHDSRFADVAELLGDNITLEFYCAIGSEYDPEPAQLDEFCSNGYVDGVSAAATDKEARYVRVTLAPTDAGGAYTMTLSMLPVLSGMLGGTNNTAALNATAVAGRNFYICNYPPMVICNPFEPAGLDFNEGMNPGDQMNLKAQGGTSWGPGNFGFLEPDNEKGGGAPETAAFLADEGQMGCTAPIITTSTGGKTNQTATAMNTRFDIYEAPFAGKATAPDDYPPAPNVIDFPRDQTWKASDPRFGNGDWDRDTYFINYHDWQLHGRPGNWADMSRWEVYNWEIAEDKLPSLSPLTDTDDSTYDGIPTPDHLYFGPYAPPPSIPERRTFNVAVVNCLAHELNGSQTVAIINPEGFARIFITEHVSKPPDADMYAEYVEWVDGSHDDYHIDIQLYE